jgi:nucleotide-binding universal stress UspA family protein
MPVVAAIDQSDRATTVVEEGKRLADGAGVDLHVVHVGTSSVPHPEGGYDTDKTNFISEQKAAGIAREQANKVIGPDEFEAVGLRGDPATELLEYATEQDADYIVVSARKRTPIGQAVFGSVTQSLLLHAECPIVAKPHEDT